MLTIEQGGELVEYARDCISCHLSCKEVEEKSFPFAKERQGVFVTLLAYPKMELRGCIGFPEPVYPLVRAVRMASVSAAVEDPRFPELSSDEFDKVAVEISVLTVPEKIESGNGESYEDKIEIGKNGLIVRGMSRSGLLLPQVPVEWGWNKKQFLVQVCAKAGLSSDAYLSSDIELFKFQAQIFSEKSPGGDVVEKEL
ncbi:MAG: TIGR00296 family protein [archaeon]|nr:TIGR00296 family protein [archaeon]